LEIIFGSIFNIYHSIPILCCTTVPDRSIKGKSQKVLKDNQG